MKLRLTSLLTFLLIGTTAYAEQNELDCLARNIYFEARGESEEGQYAVAYVTLNRVDDSRWPNSICRVVYQPNQFSWTRNNSRIHEQTAWERAQRIAEEAIENHEEGIDNTNGSVYFARTRATYFHAPLQIRIGNHGFFG